MPFMERKSFSMPCMCGAAILPEVREVTKKVKGGSEYTSVELVQVNQCKKDLPEGKDKAVYSLKSYLENGVSSPQVSSVMLYPKSVNLVLEEDSKEGPKEEPKEGPKEEPKEGPKEEPKEV